jgi:anti-sigma regulatory factor (Ser/Thr protein kinase)
MNSPSPADPRPASGSDRVELVLAPDARSAGAARRFLTATLAEWRALGYRDDAELLLSELVANAALHANTEIVVRIELRPESLHLAVSDSSPRQPVVRHYSDQSTTGRGLALVSAVALRWGIDPHPDGSKTVWAELEAHQGDRAPRLTEVPAIDLNAFPDLDESLSGRTYGEGETATFLHSSFLAA